MAWSLIPLILACLVIAAVAGQCSLRVGGPTQGQVPRIDLDASLQADAAALDFPIRIPVVPDTWIPNSATRQTVSGAAGNAESTVGFVTEAGGFLSLTQSDASEDVIVESVAGGSRMATGSTTLDDTNWVIYGGDGVEALWVADLGATRAVVTGSGLEDEYAALATATSNAKPI